MPTHDDSDDYGQDWEPVVFQKPKPPPFPAAAQRTPNTRRRASQCAGSANADGGGVWADAEPSAPAWVNPKAPPPRFDAAFVAEVRRHRTTLKMDQASYAAQVNVPYMALRDLEDGKAAFDIALRDKVAAFMRARQINA